MRLPKGSSYGNGSRVMVINCPACGAWRVNRRHKACGKCKVGLKYGKDFVFEGDWYYWEGRGWITYKEMSKLV